MAGGGARDTGSGGAGGGALNAGAGGAAAKDGAGGGGAAGAARDGEENSTSACDAAGEEADDAGLLQPPLGDEADIAPGEEAEMGWPDASASHSWKNMCLQAE